MRDYLIEGDYVLATKYQDGDPNDHFCVGFYRDMTWHSRFNIVFMPEGGDLWDDKNLVRHNGFRRAECIPKEEGDFIVFNIKNIEARTNSVWAWLRLFRMKKLTTNFFPQPPVKLTGGV